MGMPRSTAAMLCVVLAGLLCACAKPRYLIPGLTLPPDAQVITTTPGTYKGIRSVSVSFNCPAGWEAVQRHVTRCLKRAGYDEYSSAFTQSINGAGGDVADEELRELGGVLSEPDSSADPDYSATWDEYTCIYERDGVQCTVQLQYAAALYKSPVMEAYYKASHTTFDYGSLGWGDYVLGVYEY